MSEEYLVGNIIDNAKALGLSIIDGSDEEKLKYISDQIGFNDFHTMSDANKLNNELIRQLQLIDNLDSSKTNDNNNIYTGEKRNPSSENDKSNLHQNDGLDNEDSSFGQQEYNNAKDKNGVYDKNYYANRGEELNKKLEDARNEKNLNHKMKPGETGPIKSDGSNTVSKNKFDRIKDNVNVGKAKLNVAKNKIDGVKAKSYAATHPDEILKDKVNAKKEEIKDKAKDKVKEKAKDGVKQAGKQAGKFVKAGAKKLALFLAKNPYVLMFLGVVLLIIIILIIIIVIFIGAADASKDSSYDPNCNFNNTSVNLQICNGDSSYVSLDEYVIGATYSYVAGKNYSNDTIKAVMIALKTDALSLGNYQGATQNINIDTCTIDYTEEDSRSDLNDTLKELYTDIEDYLFVSESYTSQISSLGSFDYLEFTDSTPDEFEEIGGTYSNILSTYYKSYSDVVKTTPLSTISNNNTLFVGDSRTEGLKNSGLVNDSNSVSKSSQGYSWFVSSAISGINSKMQSGTSYNIVSWLGVNDIDNVNKYYDKYVELAQGSWSNHIIYVVSLGPVYDSRTAYVKQSNVDSFNSTMSSLINSSGLSNLRYIDLHLMPSDFNPDEYDSEGIHYTKPAYQRIYNAIMSSLGSSEVLSTTKTLYGVSNYCVAYENTTGDDSGYWWPIGSLEKTGDPDIYGGTPTSLVVNSLFGMRLHPIYNDYRPHNGIDISRVGQPANYHNIIASRSGTVIEAQYNSARGYYVLTEHDGGVRIYYEHLHPGTTAVKVGDTVVQGQFLGKMGTSGDSTGAHLHFEIRVNGTPVDPLEYIDPNNPRPITTSSNLSNGDTEANKKQICQFLKSNYSKNVAIGIMTNMRAESNFDSTNLQNSYETSLGYTDASYTSAVDSGAYSKNRFVYDSAGYGLTQWTYYSRKKGLYEFAKSKNKSIGDLGMQMDYLKLELTQSSYKSILQYTNAKTIAIEFCEIYENPKGSCSGRANTYYSEMASYVNNNC